MQLALNLLLCLGLAGSAFAETRRAVLVGINHYIRSGPATVSERTRERLTHLKGRPTRSKISDLEGAVNDAEQLRQLLINKYKFEAKNIILLKESDATADHILAALQTHLVDAAKPGDVSFFFYAGHGSRIRNTLTKNPSGMDSTLIPADTLLGVPDIRSKELANIYMQARKKNVDVTVIEDSCFSGGGTRGVRPASRNRFADSDDQVSVSETIDGPLPEEQGVLFLSASQDYQPAQELDDGRLGAHGAFSWALLQALSSAGENERIDRVFQRTRALMQSKVNDQEPVMLQSRGRNERGIFGQPADAFGAATAAVGLVEPSKGMLELNSGITMGLASGSELKRIVPASPAVRIRITEVNGPSSANAAPVDAPQINAITAGDLFQLDKLVVPDREFLKVYVGGAIPFSQLAPVRHLVAGLRALGSVEIIDDPTKMTPTHVLLWDSTQKLWTLSENRFEGAVLAKSQEPLAAAIAKALSGHTPKPRLAVILPAPAELTAQLSLDSHGNIIGLTDSLQRCDYFLAGRLTPEGMVEYAWARPSTTEQDLEKQYEAARREKNGVSFSGWPLRSEWIPVSDAAAVQTAAAQLTKNGIDLAKIAGWLQLQTPVPDDAFPYHLALTDEATGQISGGNVIGGHEYKLVLQRDPHSTRNGITPRRVYVFAIDAYGKGTLLFGANLNNEFPRNGSDALPEQIDLNDSKVQVTEPYGIDNYFLLTSVQPIDNPEMVFNFAGVRTRGVGPGSPLAKLIESRASGSRGALSGIPTNWSIENTPFRSIDPKQIK
ncbi:MAG TPA: caspase family protein [Bryobacteraceae bacterium]|nr:caspase family protein [Bryobacteraceae bacterium]